ncbi:MAG: glycosyltransferase family 1 protein [Magnetococcales bacterium]|nr:glycosyltransferase family 1 protein [Magnetococcales bacterium]
MRILIVTKGLYDFFYSLQGELLGLGHEVYMLHLDADYLDESKDKKKDILHGSECDLVFTANLFGGDDLKKSILNLLGSFNITCPIISVTWGHPVENLEQFWLRYDVKQINAIIKDLRVLFWSPCQKAAQEYSRLGFESIMFAGLGLSKKIHTYPFMRWLKPEQATNTEYLDLIKKTRHDFAKDISQTKIIYMGILPEKPQNVDPEIDSLVRDLVAISIADPSLSRNDMEQMWSYVFSKPLSEQTSYFNRVVLAFRYHHAMATRRVFVHRLKKEFAKDFLLIGDHWIADKLDAEPTQGIISRGLLYNQIPISIDFGSTTFETCFFPRPIEIVKNYGCLLSYRHYDSEKYFKDSSESLVFSNPDDMCEKIDALLSNPAKRDQCCEDLYRTFAQHHVMQKSIKKLIAQAMKL